MTEKRFKRTKLAEVMSHEAFTLLDKAVQEKQTFPENAKIRTVQYFGGKKTNLLTSVCVWWLKAEGYFAQRNNTTGIPRKQRDGSIKWTPAPGMGGSSDIIAIGPGGKSVFVEVKYGRDRMRPDQIKFRDAVTKQGAAYIVVKTFDDLLAKLAELDQNTFKFSAIEKKPLNPSIPRRKAAPLHRDQVQIRPHKTLKYRD